MRIHLEESVMIDMKTLVVLVIFCAVTCFQPSSRRYTHSRGYTNSNRLGVKNGLEDHQLDKAINNPIKYEKTPQIVLGVMFWMISLIF